MENFLITGISGQDGIFLASKILKSNKNIHLFGITRRPNDELFEKLSYTGLNNFKNLTLVPIDTDLINFKLLSSQEKKYLVNYLFEVYSKIHKF